MSLRVRVDARSWRGLAAAVVLAGRPSTTVEVAIGELPLLPDDLGITWLPSGVDGAVLARAIGPLVPFPGLGIPWGRWRAGRVHRGRVASPGVGRFVVSTVPLEDRRAWSNMAIEEAGGVVRALHEAAVPEGADWWVTDGPLPERDDPGFGPAPHDPGGTLHVEVRGAKLDLPLVTVVEACRAIVVRTAWLPGEGHRPCRWVVVFDRPGGSSWRPAEPAEVERSLEALRAEGLAAGEPTAVRLGGPRPTWRRGGASAPARHLLRARSGGGEVGIGPAARGRWVPWWSELAGLVALARGGPADAFVAPTDPGVRAPGWGSGWS